SRSPEVAAEKTPPVSASSGCTAADGLELEEAFKLIGLIHGAGRKLPAFGVKRQDCVLSPLQKAECQAQDRIHPIRKKPRQARLAGVDGGPSALAVGVGKGSELSLWPGSKRVLP